MVVDKEIHSDMRWLKCICINFIKRTKLILEYFSSQLIQVVTIWKCIQNKNKVNFCVSDCDTFELSF